MLSCVLVDYVQQHRFSHKLKDFVLLQGLALQMTHGSSSCIAFDDSTFGVDHASRSPDSAALSYNLYH